MATNTAYSQIIDGGNFTEAIKAPPPLKGNFTEANKSPSTSKGELD